MVIRKRTEHEMAVMRANASALYREKGWARKRKQEQLQTWAMH